MLNCSIPHCFRWCLPIFGWMFCILFAGSSFGQEALATESPTVKQSSPSESPRIPGVDSSGVDPSAGETKSNSEVVDKAVADDTEEPTPIPEKKPGKKSLQQTLQDDLLGQAKKQVENPVESILERMRNVQERLEKTATDKAIRTEQAAIVSEIDRLIDALKNQKPPSQNSSADQPPPPMGDPSDENQQARGTPQPRPENSQKQSSEKSREKEKEKQRGGKEQQQPGQTESVSDKARNSNNSTAKRPISAEEEAARQRLAKDVWGHLPLGLRQELLNIFSEKYIPKYDEQVRRYYEALAEESRNEP